MGNVCEDIVLVLHGKDACVLCDALVSDCDCFPNGIRGAETPAERTFVDVDGIHGDA